MQNASAPYDPATPNGAVYAIESLKIPCAFLALTKQICETKIEIQVKRPKMVTRLTKYRKTVRLSSATFRKARQQNKEQKARLQYGTPRLSV